MGNDIHHKQLSDSTLVLEALVEQIGDHIGSGGY
jgi:hypothetical protein